MEQTRKGMVTVLTALFLCMFPTHAFALSAGEELIALDFDDGTLDGFTTYTNGGVCELENMDGSLAVHILSCGNLDYANQAYWDGFALVRGCEYSFSFDVSCDIKRQLEYRLQLNGGDYHAYLGNFITAGPESSHIEVDFTMTEETDPAPRLAFNMGFMNDMTEDPGAHTICFDNISLRVKDPSGAEDAGSGTSGEETGSGETSNFVIGIDQVGYLPDDEKMVFLHADGENADLPQTFFVADENGETVFEGTFGDPFYDEASGGMLARGEFTEVTAAGRYTVQADADGVNIASPAFDIAEGVYDSLYRDTFDMLTYQRCGEAEDTMKDMPASEDGETFIHHDCHLSEAVIYGTSERKDVSGGWHDAGDYGRYVVPGTKAVADLFLAYENEERQPGGNDSLSGAAFSDAVLKEARYELAWMLKMQDEETGGVYHKVTCRNFPGEVWPEEETDELVIAPVSLTATLDFAAVMAKASRLYADTDPAFAEQMRTAAQRAWAYGRSAGSEGESGGFHNPPEISTGEYPDAQAEDEWFWAAAELYLAGLMDEEEAAAYLQGSGGAVNETGFGWQSVAGYGLWDLALCETGSETLRTLASNIALADAEAILSACETDGYFMALGDCYPWGSNMSVANNGLKMALAYRLTGERRFLAMARRQLHYLLGANALGFCFVTEEGTMSPEHPHHRPSQAAGEAMPGMLAGGPNSSLEDPYAQGVLQGRAPALCYVDNAQSYSTNEVAIYWNSPLVALLAMVGGVGE